MAKVEQDEFVKTSNLVEEISFASGAAVKDLFNYQLNAVKAEEEEAYKVTKEIKSISKYNLKLERELIQRKAKGNEAGAIREFFKGSH